MRKRRRNSFFRVLGIILALCVVIAGMWLLGTLLYRMYNATADNIENITGLVNIKTESTPKPTSEPTPEPTAEPTPEPEAEPTAEPVSEPVQAASKEKIEVCFEKEKANRAAITALTNYFATDIYDGKGELDYDKIHSYADTYEDRSKYLIYDRESGIWSPKNSNTWHAETLELEFASGKFMVVTLDVTYDSTNDLYVISNIQDISEDTEEPVEFTAGSTFYFVIPTLIEGDRWAE